MMILRYERYGHGGVLRVNRHRIALFIDYRMGTRAVEDFGGVHGTESESSDETGTGVEREGTV